MSLTSYALLCLVLPQVWAFLVTRIYRSLDERRERLRRAASKAPEYTI